MLRLMGVLLAGVVLLIPDVHAVLNTLAQLILDPFVPLLPYQMGTSSFRDTVRMNFDTRFSGDTPTILLRFGVSMLCVAVLFFVVLKLLLTLPPESKTHRK